MLKLAQIGFCSPRGIVHIYPALYSPLSLFTCVISYEPDHNSVRCMLSPPLQRRKYGGPGKWHHQGFTEAEIKLSRVSKCQGPFGGHFFLLLYGSEQWYPVCPQKPTEHSQLTCCWVGLRCPGSKPVLREIRPTAKETQCPAPVSSVLQGETCQVRVVDAPDKRLQRPEMVGKTAQKRGSRKDETWTSRRWKRVLWNSEIVSKNLSLRFFGNKLSELLKSHNSPGESLLRKHLVQPPWMHDSPSIQESPPEDPSNAQGARSVGWGGGGSADSEGCGKHVSTKWSGFKSWFCHRFALVPQTSLIQCRTLCFLFSPLPLRCCGAQRNSRWRARQRPETVDA